jgi:carbon starvation protein
MAKIFADVLGGDTAMAMWYHFALMFEALFILTTVDAGTRVGRFMLQDLGKHIWEPFGRVSWYPAVVLASLIVCGLWGWFLYQGVTDPLGGINSLWPLFGISNQLLATVALCVGTTIIIRMGKAKYAFVTLLPMTWLVIVTTTASLSKIFAEDPRVGFLAHAAWVRAQDLPGGARMILNDHINTGVASFFLLATLIILVDSMRTWYGVLTGRIPTTSGETPYIVSARAKATA